jgi:murein DD-endopeptidase MepM/ murein hydrolase activator NlpD
MVIYMLKNLILITILVIFSSCLEQQVITKKVTTAPASTQPSSKMKTNSFYSKTGIVKNGQGLYQALQDVSINNAQALAVINALRDEVEFSKLKVGDRLKAIFDKNNQLTRFSFSQNPAEEHLLIKDFTSNKWTYKFDAKKTFWQQRILKGSLRSGSTLQQDLLAKGLNPQVVNKVVNVLLCKVNFRMNARVGDKFEVLLSERMYNEQILETKVLYTTYQGERAGNHEAYFYEDEERSSTYTAHYTKDGQALIRSGLRYPLSSLHIRSGFGLRRHPVTGKRKMHRGIDLRAKTGRAVHAVADGKVIQSTYNEYAGNKIAIKHRDGSISYYLHLNRRRVNKGAWVKSYQVIGTVGKTGRVTGPHLHFGFKQPNGRWINPLNKRMIATPKLSGKKLMALKSQIKSIKGVLAALKLRKNYVVASSMNKNVSKKDFDFNWPFITILSQASRQKLI